MSKKINDKEEDEEKKRNEEIIACFELNCFL